MTDDILDRLRFLFLETGEVIFHEAANEIERSRAMIVSLEEAAVDRIAGTRGTGGG